MMYRALLTTALAFSFVACSSSTETGAVNRPGENIEYPKWVMKGSGVMGDGDRKLLFGVGSVNGIKNPTLARQTADNRARSEISKVFETYSASLMKDFQESVTAGDFSASSESQMVQQAIKTFSRDLGPQINPMNLAEKQW